MKVRPNGIPKGADLDATLRQIGRALHEVGDDAAGFGVEIRVEVHGGVDAGARPTSPRSWSTPTIPNVYACWNSNPTDVKNGSIKDNFALVAPKIREVHLRDLTDEKYPWRKLFALLARQGLRRLHARRDPREPRPRTRPALLPRPLAGLSADLRGHRARSMPGEPGREQTRHHGGNQEEKDGGATEVRARPPR